MADLDRPRRFRPLPQFGDLKPSLIAADHEGWLLADGRALARATYTGLFAAIGTRFGATNGSTFRLPDLRGRCLLMASGAHPLDATGGQEGATLTLAHLPEHDHASTTKDVGATVRLNLPLVTIGTDVVKALKDVVGKVAKAGASAPSPVPTLPPFQAVNLFVYAGM